METMSEFHTCRWCKQLVFNFPADTVPGNPMNPIGTSSISIPMPLAGVTHDQDSPLVKRMNALLSASAAQECLFVQEVLKGLKTSQEELMLRNIFSWVGGIELTTPQLSFCIASYYFFGRPGSDNFLVDPLFTRTPSDTLRHAAEWISDCENSHTECRQKYEENFFPKRLLRILSVGRGYRIKLVHPDKPRPYTALSYCWGGDQSTKCSTLNERIWEEQGIPWEELPQIIQDAILATHALGVDYIWVDALCILQNDEIDKSAQIAKMPHIYDSAVITISALGAAGVHDQLTNPMRMPWVKDLQLFELSATGAPLSYANVLMAPSSSIDVRCLEDMVLIQPLDQRAWTFQESLLSRRLLRFSGHNITWQCRQVPEFDFENPMDGGAQILESNPLHPAISRMRHQANLAYILETGLLYCANGCNDPVPDTSFNQPDMYPWHRLVEEYTRRSMTFAEDRARAISGIAERIGARTGDQYCAGLWRSSLINQLAWSIHDYESRVQYTEYHYRCQGEETEPVGNAPSWSWFSQSKPIKFHVSDISFTMQVIGIQMELAQKEHKFGDVKSGHLTVRGQSKSVEATAHIAAGSQSNISKQAPGRNILLKLGTVHKSRIPDGLAVCLMLKETSSSTWVRAGMCFSPDEHWLETQTIIIV